MALDRINPTTTNSWKKLESLNSKIDIKSLFENDDSRFEKYSISFGNMFVDFSKNLVDDEILESLLKLSNECNLKEAIEKQFNGDEINETEGRAVLHTALRSFDKNSVFNQDIINDRNKIQKFSDDIINGCLLSSSGKQFTDVVNIGIGGSDLGAVMVVEALKYYKTRLNIHFVSNVDGDHVHEILVGSGCAVAVGVELEVADAEVARLRVEGGADGAVALAGRAVAGGTIRLEGGLAGARVARPRQRGSEPGRRGSRENDRSECHCWSILSDELSRVSSHRFGPSRARKARRAGQPRQTTRPAFQVRSISSRRRNSSAVVVGTR